MARRARCAGSPTLWPCRTCAITYCEGCLPEEVSFAGEEIVCDKCNSLLRSDGGQLQRDLLKWGVCQGI